MNNKVLVTILLIAVLVLSACESISSDQDPQLEVVMVDETSDSESIEIQEQAELEVIEEPIFAYQECLVNADCLSGELCIESECRSIDSLYSQDCEQTCNFATAQIRTSDGETYNIGKSQGSYSYAGAIEWKLLSTPPYCPRDDFVVPILISKKNAGKVLSEEVITVPIGVESKLITHPTISRVQFRIEVESVDETCG